MFLLMPHVPMILPSALRRRQLRGQRPMDAAIGKDFLLHQPHYRLAGLEDPLLVLEGRPGVLFGEIIEIRLADHFARVGHAKVSGHGAADT